MASCTREQAEAQRQRSRGSTSRPERPAIIIPELWEDDIRDDACPKPWDLEVIRNERAGRRQEQFSESSCMSFRKRNRESFGARTDGGSDTPDGPAANPFLDPADDIAPDDSSSPASLREPEIWNNVTMVTPSGTFAVSHPPPPQINPSKSGKRKTETRYQGPHPFVPGKARHKYPGEVNRRHFTQYVYSTTETNLLITHHFLCETSDLEKPLFYYHDVGGYTRLDPNHSLTLHHGSYSNSPILGAMWHSRSGMNFAVGNPYMNLMDKDNQNVTAIQRQHCDFLKPISSAPSRWHMDFTFGGGEEEGPKKHYRWQIVNLAEAIPRLRRHGKLELREKDDGTADEEGKKKEKGKLLAACRNVNDLGTNLWVRDSDSMEELGNDLARLRWKTWVLLTWGAMRDRMKGPHNTGSPYHNIGYTKSTRVVEVDGDRFPLLTGAMGGGASSPRKTEEIRERRLNPEEY